ncbi:unannotated protein [freshwater metagenome]|uniref:Unannotated protein n=1 Tax=freshwater metagenome TaxID=449393 RepID=A0A6J7MD54_9ZZZZ
MIDHGIVIPTRGDRESYLNAIIATVDLPASHIIITTNSAKYRDTWTRTDATLIVDLAPINIHRWWNAGINALQSKGATYATVLNDDVSITPDSVQRMRDALERTGATLAHPGRPGELVGCAWTLNVTHGVRCDERYQWWYGDNQLWLDAQTRGHGIIDVPEAGIVHLEPNRKTTLSPALQALALVDRRRWQQRHPLRWALARGGLMKTRTRP